MNPDNAGRGDHDDHDDDGDDKSPLLKPQEKKPSLWSRLMKVFSGPGEDAHNWRVNGWNNVAEPNNEAVDNPNLPNSQHTNSSQYPAKPDNSQEKADINPASQTHNTAEKKPEDKEQKPGIGSRVMGFLDRNQKAIALGMVIGTALGGVYFIGAVAAFGAAVGTVALVGYACYKIGKTIANFIGKKIGERKSRQNLQGLGQGMNNQVGQGATQAHSVHSPSQAQGQAASPAQPAPYIPTPVTHTQSAHPQLPHSPSPAASSLVQTVQNNQVAAPLVLTPTTAKAQKLKTLGPAPGESTV